MYIEKFYCSFPAAAAQLSLCKEYVTFKTLIKSIAQRFRKQCRICLSSSVDSLIAASSSIRLFLDSRLVASEYIPKELPQLQTFSSRWKCNDASFF